MRRSGGGLARAALHELAPAAPAQFGAAAGFALALAALRAAEAARAALFIQTDFARAGGRRALWPRPRRASACRWSG